MCCGAVYNFISLLKAVLVYILIFEELCLIMFLNQSFPTPSVVSSLLLILCFKDKYTSLLVCLTFNRKILSLFLVFLSE